MFYFQEKGCSVNKNMRAAASNIWKLTGPKTVPVKSLIHLLNS